MNKSFILHLDTLNILNEMTNEQAGTLFKAIYEYQKGSEPILDFAMKMAFMPFKNQFARDAEKYLRVCERNKNNGLKGGRPKNELDTITQNNPKNPVGYLETQNNPKEPKKPDSDSDSDSDSENNNINIEKNIFENSEKPETTKKEKPKKPKKEKPAPVIKTLEVRIKDFKEKTFEAVEKSDNVKKFYWKENTLRLENFFNYWLAEMNNGELRFEYELRTKKTFAILQRLNTFYIRDVGNKIDRTSKVLSLEQNRQKNYSIQQKNLKIN